MALETSLETLALGLLRPALAEPFIWRGFIGEIERDFLSAVRWRNCDMAVGATAPVVVTGDGGDSNANQPNIKRARLRLRQRFTQTRERVLGREKRFHGCVSNI